VSFEQQALKDCETLLNSPAAKLCPPEQVQSVAIVAYILGAAWALGEPYLVELANAQIESWKKNKS